MSDLLQFKAASGHVFFLDNLIAFVIGTASMMYLCWMTVKKQYDKIFHCVLSALITFVIGYVLQIIGWPWWIAPIVALTIGFSKEMADKLNKKKQLFDWFDIVADVIGITSVTIPYLVLK